MKSIKLIQYVSAHATEALASEALYRLALLDGMVGGRVTYKPDPFRDDFPYKTQSFFTYEEGVNPDAVNSCLGMRLVTVPVSLLATLGTEQQEHLAKAEGAQ